MKLFSKLDDRAAEQISGGEGIGQELSSGIQDARDLSKALGERNANQALRNETIIFLPDPSVKNQGQAVKTGVKQLKM